uniref:Ig-like domain-containing protein n=1 Tax=Cyprinodon variegatus TaxID=28743 RepID=A0A3Q2FHX7_CYPVA
TENQMVEGQPSPEFWCKISDKLHVYQSSNNVPQEEIHFVIFYFLSSLPEGTATFIAKIGGDPIPSVKWMKGKWRQITPGGRISVEHKGQDAKLEIREVTKSDSGLYRCVATNKHGEIECGAEMEVTKKEEGEGLGDIRTRLKK